MRCLLRTSARSLSELAETVDQSEALSASSGFLFFKPPSPGGFTISILETCGRIIVVCPDSGILGVEAFMQLSADSDGEREMWLWPGPDASDPVFSAVRYGGAHIKIGRAHV